MMKTELIDKFTRPDFQRAFKQYFSELGIGVRDWDGLFREMGSDGHFNRAYLLTDMGRVVGFLQFCQMECQGWFMRKTLGFIREFWVAPEHRRQGHGRELMGLAEGWLSQRGVSSAALTTDTAWGFYEKLGYRRDPGLIAKNGDPVYIKHFYY